MGNNRRRVWSKLFNPQKIMQKIKKGIGIRASTISHFFPWERKFNENDPSLSAAELDLQTIINYI